MFLGSPRPTDTKIFVWLDKAYQPIQIPINTAECSSVFLIVGRKGVVLDINTGVLPMPLREVGNMRSLGYSGPAMRRVRTNVTPPHRKGTAFWKLTN
jgi:hypothetical protein